MFDKWRDCQASVGFRCFSHGGQAAFLFAKWPLDRVVDKLCPHFVPWCGVYDIASGMVDCDGLTSKLFCVKRNGSARLCTAEIKVSRQNKVAAERLLKTKCASAL